MRISLKQSDYNGERAPTSPRSVEACLRLGIDPQELLSKARSSFFAGVTRCVGEMRYQHFEEQRRELVKMAVAERLRIDAESGEEADSTFGAQRSSSISRSPSSPSVSFRTLGSTPRTARSPGVLRSPDAAATSAARIRSIKDEDEQKRMVLHHKTEVALAEAEQRRRIHVDALSNSVDVVERVAAARHRWIHRESALRKKHSELVATKLNRIEAQREAHKEKTQVQLMQSIEAKEMRIAEARERVHQMQAARKARLENSMQNDNERCAAAVQRVEEQRTREATERRLKFEDTMIHAAELKAIVEERKRAEAEELEALVEAKRELVEERHKQMQLAQHRKGAMRRHYFEYGERIQQGVRNHQQLLARQRAVESLDRIRAAEVEREMVLEAKREAEEDHRLKCLRARRAMEYSERKRKQALVLAKEETTPSPCR